MRRLVCLFGAVVLCIGCGTDPSVPVTPSELQGEGSSAALSEAVRACHVRAIKAWKLYLDDRDEEALQDATNVLQTLESLEEELATAPPSVELANVRHAQAQCAKILENLEVCERNSRSAVEMRRKLLGSMSVETLASELLLADARFRVRQDTEALGELERVVGALERLGDSQEAWFALRMCSDALSTLSRLREALAYEQRALDMAQRETFQTLELRSQIQKAVLWRDLGYPELARSLLGPIHQDLEQREERSLLAVNVAGLWATLLPEDESSRQSLLEDQAESFRRIAKDCKAAGALHLEGWAWKNRAEALMQVGSYEEAETALQEMQRLGQELEDELLQLAFHWSRGLLLAAQKQGAGAVEELQQALTLAQQLNRVADVAGLQLQLGMTFQQNDAVDQALQAFEASLLLGEAHPTLVTTPYTAYLAGQIYQERKLPQMALQRYQQSLVGYTRLEYKPSAAYVHGDVGNMQRELGFWKEAAESYGEAVKKIRTFELNSDVPNYLKLQGEALLQSDAAAEAIPVLTEALQLWPEAGDPMDRAWLGLWLAISQLKVANTAEAVTALRDMDAVLQGLPTSVGRAYFSREAGDKLRDAGYAAEALMQYRQADKGFQEAGWGAYAALMPILIGDCQREQGEDEAAFASYLSGLERLATLKRETYDAFGWALLQICSHDLMPEYLNGALEAYEKLGETNRAAELRRNQQTIDLRPTPLGIVGLVLNGTTSDDLSAAVSLPENANKDRYRSHTFVEAVAPDMPAAIEGTLQAGDELIAVIQQDGSREETSGYTSEQVGALLIKGVPETSVILVLKRKGSEETLQTKPIIRKDPRTDESRKRIVSIARNLLQEKGLEFKEKEFEENNSRALQGQLAILAVYKNYNHFFVYTTAKQELLKFQETRAQIHDYMEILRPEGLLK